MKVSFNWLQQYVNLPSEAMPTEVAKRLTFSGLEVEALDSLSKGFDKVFVGQILERNQHPNADRLSLCKITVGNALSSAGEILEIVCGAQNIKAGDKIPVATIGANLPNGMEIKAAKIRNVASSGMLCSPQELQLTISQKEDGIYILPADAPVGMPFAKFMGFDDWIFTINVTPNRGDALSHIGIAREVAALFGIPLKLPEVKVQAKALQGFSVDNAVGEDCSVYFASVIEGVKVGPSPEWLKKRLESIGLRSINNVVDVTNFILMEVGQPLHAFDADLLGGKKITVRRGKNSEKFSTISHKELELKEADLVISSGTSGEKAVALAGVMGSDNSEVHEGTKNILLEAAEFQPALVRKTSRRFGLLTDASYRFERGIDTGKVEWAMLRAIELFQELAGGKYVGTAASAQTKQSLAKAPLSIRLRLSDIEKTLGKSPELNTATSILRSLGIRAELAAGEQGVLNAEIPFWRKDIKRSADLVEEVARIWGFDKLESKLPHGKVSSTESRQHSYFQVRRVRRHLSSLGFSEAINLGFTSREELGKALSEVDLQRTVALLNPLNAEFSVLKPSLVPGLLANVARNFSHRQKNVRLFEVRRVFQALEKNDSNPRYDTGVQETLRLSLVLTGDDIDEQWQSGTVPVDFYALKGILDTVLELLGKAGVQYRVAATPVSYIHPGQCAELAQGKRVYGYLGRLHPQVEKNYGFEQAVYVAEVDLENFLTESLVIPKYKAFGKFPQVERDFSAVVADSVSAQQIRDVVAKVAKPLLRDLRFFDVYKGSRVPEKHLSYAFRIFLGAEDHTLTDAEISAVQEKVMKSLEAEHGARFAGM